MSGLGINYNQAGSLGFAGQRLYSLLEIYGVDIKLNLDDETVIGIERELGKKLNRN